MHKLHLGLLASVVTTLLSRSTAYEIQYLFDPFDEWSSIDEHAQGAVSSDMNTCYDFRLADHANVHVNTENKDHRLDALRIRRSEAEIHEQYRINGEPRLMGIILYDEISGCDKEHPPLIFIGISERTDKEKKVTPVRWFYIDLQKEETLKNMYPAYYKPVYETTDDEVFVRLFKNDRVTGSDEIGFRDGRNKQRYIKTRLFDEEPEEDSLPSDDVNDGRDQSTTSGDSPELSRRQQGVRRGRGRGRLPTTN